uniref:Endoplasmic reticulum resident protein 29 C-terminal domain-containing protein n=1 Tax=Aegilops tauschii subsp. strangulata TaxID=200361 RepID=A0A452Y1I9_AEGTS
KIYVNVAKKILQKGSDYTKKETERLHRLLEKVGNKKVDSCHIIIT